MWVRTGPEDSWLHFEYDDTLKGHFTDFTHKGYIKSSVALERLGQVSENNDDVIRDILSWTLQMNNRKN